MDHLDKQILSLEEAIIANTSRGYLDDFYDREHIDTTTRGMVLRFRRFGALNREAARMEGTIVGELVARRTIAPAPAPPVPQNAQAIAATALEEYEKLVASPSTRKTLNAAADFYRLNKAAIKSGEELRVKSVYLKRETLHRAEVEKENAALQVRQQQPHKRQ